MLPDCPPSPTPWRRLCVPTHHRLATRQAILLSSLFTGGPRSSCGKRWQFPLLPPLSPTILLSWNSDLQVPLPPPNGPTPPALDALAYFLPPSHTPFFPLSPSSGLLHRARPTDSPPLPPHAFLLIDTIKQNPGSKQNRVLDTSSGYIARGCGKLRTGKRKPPFCFLRGWVEKICIPRYTIWMARGNFWGGVEKKLFPGGGAGKVALWPPVTAPLK